MPSNHLILCCPLLLPPSIFPSIRVFSNESALSIRWPKYWSFSFSISPSDEYSALISFNIHWIDLLAVQGTLKGLLQHHSLKVSVLWHSAFLFSLIFHCWNLLFAWLPPTISSTFISPHQNQERPSLLCLQLPWRQPVTRHRQGLSSHPQVTTILVSHSPGTGRMCWSAGSFVA